MSDNDLFLARARAHTANLAFVHVVDKVVTVGATRQVVTKSFVPTDHSFFRMVAPATHMGPSSSIQPPIKKCFAYSPLEDMQEVLIEAESRSRTDYVQGTKANQPNCPCKASK